MIDKFANELKARVDGDPECFGEAGTQQFDTPSKF
jgi:hypothetical protein